MPRPEDAREAQLAHALESPRLCPAHRVTRQGRRLEGALPAICDGFGGGLVAEPVADPVGVAGPDDGLHALLDHVGELGEEGAGVVARGGELLVGCVGAFLVCGLCANGLDDGARLQVIDIGFRRVGIVARGADIVDVEIGGLGEGTLDAVVADLVGVCAGGVGAG